MDELGALAAEGIERDINDALDASTVVFIEGISAQVAIEYL